MGYVQEARENHVKKKVEEVFPWSSGTGSLFLTCKYFKISALRSKMKQKALKECDEYAANTNESVLEEMKKEYALQQDGKEPMRL
nr:uncharacterized protein DDB_G0275933 [Ipomoea batatas]GMC68395.1 uncharacterized protein DDB_G0275933 [Ipomoea batatas]